MAKAPLRERTKFVDPAGDWGEPFRALRLALDLRTDVRTGNAVVVTSPGRGDGKSTIAANYALVAAREGERQVLLVDADLRNPTLHEFFRVPRSPGLVDLLVSARGESGGPLLASTTHVPFASGLEVLTAGAPVPSAGDIATSRGMKDLLARASSMYDLVVIDSPPVLQTSDASGLASHAGTDVIVVVRDSGRRRPLIRTLRELELTGANVLGLVVNRGGRGILPEYF